MKLLFLFLAITISFSAGAIESRQLKCSGSGTDILLVNGISWSSEIVQSIIDYDLNPAIPKNLIDSKSPAGTYVDVDFSYNQTGGFHRDLIESLSQKLSQNFKISSSATFVIAYYALNKGVITEDFFSTIVNEKKLTFANALNFLKNSLDPLAVEKLVQDANTTKNDDTRKLKLNISKTLLSGKKLILITESQGNLFAREAITDFMNGEHYKGTYRVTVSVFDENGVFLFNEVSFILADQRYGVFGGVPISGPNVRTVEEYLASLPISPTSKEGFVYEAFVANFGTCYSKGVEYFYDNGVRYVLPPYYNCTIFEENL